VSLAPDPRFAPNDGEEAATAASLARQPEWDDDADGSAASAPAMRDRDAAAGSVRTEAVWHGGGTRDAYEALLILLFAPEPEPVRGVDA
jgi:hypothetical protein